MDAGAARTLARFDSALAEALGADTAATVRRAVADPASGGVVVGPHGSSVVYASSHGRARRVLELDRDGTPLAVLRWRHDELAAAWLRIPDGSWLMVEPAVTADAPWGLSDGIARAERPGASGVPLTVFEALRWSRVDRIPTLAEPAALPAGGGAAVLNLIAALATDEGRSRLTYRGPYPTETLFLTLLESFRYEPTGDDPLAQFTHDTLEWIPAPHVGHFTAEGVYVQLRGRIEKVVWRSRTYYRPEWQGIARHAPRRVRDTPDGVRCSLWALGAPLEDHLVLTPDGAFVRLAGEPAPAVEISMLPPAIAAGLGAVVATLSAPPLGPALRALARDLHLEWGPVDADLLALDGNRGRISARLRTRLQAALSAAPTASERGAVAMAALSEIALLLGDGLRSRAQAQLSGLPEVEQRALLTSPPPADPGDARAIAGAVEALGAEADTEAVSRRDSRSSRR